jgi:pyruvate/2-oxoacid:ferredoxin oxidoreductase alpha subunit
MTASPALAIPTRYNPLATHNKPTQVRDGNRVHPSQGNHAESVMQKSYQNSLQQRQHTFRAFFADRWASFLHDNYHSPEHVAVVFGVSGQTANNWWSGVNAPSGYAVAMAFQTQPQSAARHLSADAA